MRRRAALFALPLALSGCGSVLPQRPYVERRAWPLALRRPVALPPRRHGKVLLVRALRAGPGLESRGLQTLQPDGSVRIGYYEEWSVPPAEGAEDALRRWLRDAGLFAVVLAPGSRLAADLVLEGELDALIAEPAAGRARAALAYVLLDQRRAEARPLVQRTANGEAPLASADPPAVAAACRAALAAALEQVEEGIRPFA